MIDRPTVALSSDDGVAALQILAWLAYPRRVTFGWNILEEWTRHRARASPTEKWGRLEQKLRRFDDMVKRHLKGAYWLRLQLNQRFGELTGDFFHSASQRECARLFGAESECRSSPSVTNVIRDYWTATRSVAHVGLATGDAIWMTNSLDDRSWDLVRVAFRADWVREAIRMAEVHAKAADEFGVIPLNQAVLFTRDSN